MPNAPRPSGTTDDVGKLLRRQSFELDHSGSLRLLVDTHILVWLAEGTADLESASIARLEDAARERGLALAVSAISFW